MNGLLPGRCCYRTQRSLDSRLRKARFGRFKAMSDFDWNMAKAIVIISVIEQWMQLDFMKGASNLILCGPNGVGKTMIVSNYCLSMRFFVEVQPYLQRQQPCSMNWLI